MANREFCYLYLTCEDDHEARDIVNELLEKNLIVCAKQLPVNAKFWWNGKATHGHEKLLIMESALDLFDEVEKAVTKLHSYDMFVLEAVRIEKVSKKAKQWMEESLKKYE